MNPFTDVFKAWFATVIYIMTIFLSSGAVGAIQIWLRHHGMQRIVSAALLAIFVALVVYVLVFRLNRRAIGDIAALVTAGLVYVYLIKTYAKAPSDWVHLIEYPPLAVISYYSLKFSVRGAVAFVCALLLASAVGVGDEFTQRYIPGRTSDIHDFIVNVISSAVALAVVWAVIERKEKVVEG
jgi:VanZ family protein